MEEHREQDLQLWLPDCGAMWPWASHFISLSLRFFTCKMKIVTTWGLLWGWNEFTYKHARHSAWISHKAWSRYWYLITKLLFLPVTQLEDISQPPLQLDVAIGSRSDSGMWEKVSCASHLQAQPTKPSMLQAQGSPWNDLLKHKIYVSGSLNDHMEWSPCCQRGTPDLDFTRARNKPLEC